MPEQKLEVGMWYNYPTQMDGICPARLDKIFFGNTELRYSGVVFIGGKKYPFNCGPEYIKKVTNLRAPGEFKAGDEVYFPNSRACGFVMDEGAPFIITSVTRDTGIARHYGWKHRDDEWLTAENLSLITPVEVREQQKPQSSGRVSTVTPGGGIVSGQIEPSYFPPDVEEDEPEKPELHVGDEVMIHDEEIGPDPVNRAVIVAKDEATEMLIAQHDNGKVSSIFSDDEYVTLDHCPHVHETQAERIRRHFGAGIGEQSVNRRNGTIGGR